MNNARYNMQIEIYQGQSKKSHQGEYITHGYNEDLSAHWAILNMIGDSLGEI